METPGQQDQIGTPWIIAIVALLALLVLGVILYARLSVRIDEPRKRSSAITAPAASEFRDSIRTGRVELNTRWHTRV